MKEGKLIYSNERYIFIAFYLLIFGLFAIVPISGTAQRNDCDDNAAGEISVNGSCTYSAMNSSNNTDYWNGASGNCGSSDIDDVWCWFVAIGNSTTITYDPTGGVFNPVMTLFTGTCSTTMSEITCANAAGAGGNETIVYSTTPGQKYRIRIQDASSNSSYSGQICIYGDPCAAIGGGGTYTIGESGDDFLSITEALCSMDALGTITAPYIFELQSDYNESRENFPIVFNPIAGANSTNTITFRPAAGANSLVISDAYTGGSAMFEFNGGDYYVIDGQPGGSGGLTANCLTIRNTEPASGSARHVVELINDATYNTFKYCYLEAETQNPYGNIEFGATTGTTGNDYNTLSYCYIGDPRSGGSAARPQYGVHSSGTAGKENDNNTIDNCEFVDIHNSGATSANIWIFDNSETWTITNNHFYQTTNFSSNNDGSGMILISDGGGYTVTGNYLGGRAKSCGGSAFTITSGINPYYGIYFSSACSGAANIVSGNTIQNMDLTTTMSALSTLLIGIWTNGTSDFTVGSSGSGNVIGSQSATGSIQITANGVCYSFTGILNNSSGTIGIGYNQIGGITVGGTDTDTYPSGVEMYDGIVTLDNNIIGSTTTANSITVSSGHDSQIWAIYNSSTGAFTCTNNTIQNLDLNGVSEEFRGIYNSTGPMDNCTGNTIKNIDIAGTQTTYPIYHLGSTATIASNTISDFTCVGPIYGIATGGTGIVTINSNTIGSTSDNNMLCTGDYYSLGIYANGSSTTNVTNNIIQEWYINNAAGVIAEFNGVYATAGINIVTGNFIRNIDVNASTSGSTIVGIEFNGGATSTSQEISSNVISKLYATNSGNVGNDIYGIKPLTGGGTAKKNQINNLEIKSSSINCDLFGYYHSGTFNAYNNVVMLSNGLNTGPTQIAGIYEYGSGCNYYHNTVIIDGDQGGGTDNTYALYKSTTATGTLNIDNNVFVNRRTNDGSTYGMYFADLTPAPICDYNYIEGADHIGYDGSNRTTIGAWQGAAGGPNSETGTESFNFAGAPESPTFVGADMANNLLGSVSDDIDGAARDATPWAGAFESDNVALPVTFMLFDAKRENTKVKLVWKTGVEQNLDYFTLERSGNGWDFEEVGRTYSLFNKNQFNEYFFWDESPIEGVSYYRVIAVDQDGFEDQSVVRLVEFGTNNQIQAIVYPNPVKAGEMMILEAVGWKSGEVLKMQLLNSLGEIVLEELLSADREGKFRSEFDLSPALKDGYYFIALQSSNQRVWQKLLIR